MKHFMFNRLHNVIQNSSGYRTYPGLKSSRFSHTIGVMHVATELFVNAVTNVETESNGEQQGVSSMDAKEAFAALQKEAAEASKHAIDHFGDELPALTREISISFAVREPFCVLLAVLRAASLIHDIGHLPYSHIFENALEALLHEKIDKVFAIADSVKEKRRQLSSLLQKFSDASGHPGHQPALHEIVGLVLAKQLAGELKVRVALADFKEQKSDAIARMRFCAFVLELAIELLRGDLFPITASIIKGTIDADRLDFVKRDGIASGLFQSGIDFDRLFALYSVRQRTERDDAYWIVPSSRTISDVEKLLWERFQDYRYINAHHKVHLYDELLENIIIRMMASGELNDFIGNLIWLLAEEHSQNISEQQNNAKAVLGLLLEFDDPWLESRIRSIYKTNISDPEHNRLLTGDEHVKALFEGYIEDREKFVTLFKVDDDFWRLCAETHTLRTLSPGVVKNSGVNWDCNDILKFRRGLIQRTLEGAKFRLQKRLSEELNCTVLVGSTRKKIRYGITSEAEAKELGVGSLRDFLRTKKYETAPFNCWYTTRRASRSIEEKNAFEVRLILLIDNFLTAELGSLEEMKSHLISKNGEQTAVKGNVHD